MSDAAAHHTSTGLDSRKLAFWAFIGSECLLFGSLISTYLVYEGRSVSGPTTGEIHLRHHMTADGYYRGRQVIAPKTKVVDEE